MKERLTGAAILVALIVLLVPEIFRGQRDDARPAPSAAGSEGAPLRSYTIDLSNKGREPLQSTGENAADASAKAQPAAPPAPSPAAPAPVPSVASPESRASIPETRVPEAHSPEAHASEARPSSPAPRAASELRTSPVRPSAAAHAPRSESASTRAPTPPPASAPASPSPPKATGGAWSVQLGLFAKRENAERLSSDAHNKGFQTGISSDAKGQYRVRASGATDRTGAESLAQRLRSAGFAAAIVAPGK